MRVLSKSCAIYSRMAVLGNYKTLDGKLLQRFCRVAAAASAAACTPSSCACHASSSSRTANTPEKHVDESFQWDNGIGSRSIYVALTCFAGKVPV